MKYRIIKPRDGDVVIIKSDEWYVFEGGIYDVWRLMTVEEQIQASS